MVSSFLMNSISSKTISKYPGFTSNNLIDFMLMREKNIRIIKICAYVYTKKCSLKLNFT